MDRVAIALTTLATLGGLSCNREHPWPQPGSAVAESDFTVIVLPDTQNYIDGKLDTFARQTQWIADNAARLRVAQVLHVGDIVNWNKDHEWRIAKDAISTLDAAAVPYALAIGNHDMGENGSAGDRSTGFNRYFSPPETIRRRRDDSGFGGWFEEGHLENSYHFFSAAGQDWMVVVLEFGPRDEVLTWAGKIVAENPKRRVMVVTHAYMYSDGTRHSHGDDYHPRAKGMANIAGNTINDGEDMWRKFVRHHDNIELVLSGHITRDGGASRLTSRGNHGNRVHQILSDYQAYPNGGDGWLRIMRFAPRANRIWVWTYSPTRGDYLTGPAHQFQLSW